MNIRRILLITLPLMLVAALMQVFMSANGSQAVAQMSDLTSTSSTTSIVDMPSPAAAATPPKTHKEMNHVTQAQREAAAGRAMANGLPVAPIKAVLQGSQPTTAALDPLGVPDYFGTIPNYANSPLTHIQPMGSARDYYSPWYDGVYMNNWVLMANPAGGTTLGFNLSIAGAAKSLPDSFGQGAGVVPGGRTLFFSAPGTIGGPVKTSLGGGEAVVSQRSLIGNSLEEVVATDASKLSDHFYWTWYDELSPGYRNWVLVDNPSATETIHAVVSFTNTADGATVTGESDIAPGGSWTPEFPGKMGGPVELKAYLQGGSWPANARNVVASQRVTSNYGTAFNEMPGIPAGELTSSYIWTWYDMASVGFSNWVLLANPDPVNPVTYEVKIAGAVVGGGTIAGGGIATPTFPGQINGPVEVTTSANVIASQRIIAGPSFGEVAGFPQSALARTYDWTWYDNASAGATNWVLIGNPDPANAVTYAIRIGDSVVSSGTIPAGGRVIPTFPGQINGPVEVLASANVIASQRVLWNGYFNEVMGVGGLVPAGSVIPDTGIRKFVDGLPGLNSAGANNLGQYIPVAIPDQDTYPGSDYYEISLVEYTEQMHSDLPATKLRGYKQTNTTDPTVSVPHYLGPTIVAHKDRPVRIKFTNELPTGSGGDLFLPVDTTLMGAGAYEIDDPANPGGTLTGDFTQNRATLHLHGGDNPWISDGTPHQWITPAGEETNYAKGMSQQNVPDMYFDPVTHNPVPEGTPGATNDPGPGSATFFYPNQQSARMMFYHDHAYGITRLNVYAGEAAGYLLQDDTEQQLVTDGVIPADQIPLIIQDKGFVPDPAQLEAQDPTWDSANWGGEGSLWLPHVYMPAQNPADPSGMNAMGRWHYGPWFWPPTTGIANPPIANPLYDCGPGGPCTRPWEPSTMPATPNPSWGAESFVDTPVVNGTAYPTITVDPKAYRLRVLNAANDRFWNLQLYKADPATITRDVRQNTEVKMVPADPTPGYPADWPIDGRDGGVPDPATAGPQMIQIGNEGGVLPAPVVLPNQPIDWNMDQTAFNFGNVTSHTLLLGPAERGDVVVDFSQYAGQTLILYNDAPSAFPARDPRNDYYTGAPDLTDTGGAPTPPVGYGPNVRTIMQIKVAATAPAAPFDLNALNTAFASTASTQGAFAASQDPILVPQSGYDSALNGSFPDNLAHIYDFSMNFTPVGGASPLNIPFENKAIQDEMGETFDGYGRMAANLGLENRSGVAGVPNFILQGYIDPPTEEIQDNMVAMSPVAGDGTQIWKITQNGVDTHTIHFHLFNVQLINRVAWDNKVIMPDPTELGWKETIRVNPLEDTIVALRPVAPTLTFDVPGSLRPLDVTQPLGSTMGFRSVDPVTGQPIVPPMTNKLFNFGWEYVFHCHLLSHEENDMMRPVRFSWHAPAAPSGLTALEAPAGTVNLDWVNNATSPAAATFVIERSLSAAFDDERVQFSVTAPTVTYDDTTVAPFTTYYYRVRAENATGFSAWSSTATVTTGAGP